MGLLGVILSRGSWIEIVSCIVAASIVSFLAMPVHEFAHGFAATKLGDPTPRWQGRLTLKPTAHLDYFGTLMIFLAGFGFAKPVQVDSRYFEKPKRDMAIVAFAGPLSNLIIAFLASFISNLLIFIYYLLDGVFFTFFNIIVSIFSLVSLFNINLAVFNLIPIPPLDGSKILAILLPDRIYYQLMRYERYFTLIIFVLIFAGSGFSSFLSNATGGLLGLFDAITWLPFKLILG